LAVLGAAAGVSLLLGLRVWHDAYYIASRRPDRFGVGLNRAVLPADAAAYATRARLDGRMLNHLNFGGYLMWALPEPVFVDGRLEVIGEAFYEHYRSALASPEALEAAVARYAIGWIVFPYKTNPQLLGRLSRDRRWRLAYFDHLAAIFIRDGPQASAKVEPATLQATAGEPPPLPHVAELPGLGGGPRLAGVRQRWSSLLARERFPEEPFSHGLFHYFRGEPRRAAPQFALAVRASGGAYYEIYNNLGSALFRLGRWKDAAACYRVVLEDAPQNEVARKRLAEIESQVLPLER
jgi:tetratricopeptide (TPR) repeat protein